MSSGVYKAVCYRCSYEGQGSANRCPICQFPMILEPENTPPGGRSLGEIFPRGQMGAGAPPLPGVHAEKRKAQLMAEARRERIATQRHARMERSLDLPLPAPGMVDLASASSVRIPRFRRGPLTLTLFCASAVAAGAVVAALQSGGL
ncbi:MAG TPA: hypothetical protein VNO33_03310 [Kofleriaceae bacterium]|nr:hypothetical protein [Kofleriaceae bacterium]